VNLNTRTFKVKQPVKHFGTISIPVLVGALTFFMAMSSLTLARDLGQWASFDPSISKWFESLMMPDNPTISCCGGSDAYFADTFETDGDRYVAIITDTRADEPLGRHHVEAGTRISVPTRKLKVDSGNPTGHGVIFLSSSDTVFCYVVPGGI
jgi:hypothetical protein